MLLTPMLAEPPPRLGEIDADAPDPARTFARGGAFTPFSARVQRDRPAGDLAAAVRGRRPAGGGADRRPAGGRGQAARARRAAGGRAAVDRPSRPDLVTGPSTRRGPGRWTSPPARLRAAPRRPHRGRESIDTSISSASSQVAKARLPASISSARSPRDTSGVGIDSSGAATPVGAQQPGARSLAWLSNSGPASSKRSWLAWPARRAGRASAAITQSATSSAQIGWYSARPRPETGITGSSARRSSSVSQRSPGAYTIEGANTVVCSAASRTACSASALARNKRVRWWVEAPSVEKNTKRAHPGPLGGLHHAPGGDAVELLDRTAALIADRAGQVDDRVHSPQGIAKRGRVAQIAERDLHPHALRAEPARVAHQAAHRLRGSRSGGAARARRPAPSPRSAAAWRQT